ncbi:MAG: polysaccharide biosynthesis/export family protein [Thermodesulfobacteriota bacterium]|nr:polysaccharide biosynthesis/export family protein [Thermodesulfobacteriota bacterium]
MKRISFFRDIARNCFVLFAGAVVLLIFQSEPLSAASSDSADHARKSSSPDVEYKIGLGDIIEVQVWKEEELSRVLAVRIDGRISLPLIGDVVAAGKSTGELALDLEKQFSQLVGEPVVSVMLTDNRSQKYYIMGQIGEAGEFAIDYPITVVQAIARSKGFKEWADKSGITVLRRENGRERMIMFNYESFVKGRSPEQNILIMPGDTIIVP